MQQEPITGMLGRKQDPRILQINRSCMETLTQQQKRVLMWLTQYQKQNLTTPSYAEMAKAFEISINTIKGHIDELQKKRFIKRSLHAKRSIVVLKIEDGISKEKA